MADRTSSDHKTETRAKLEKSAELKDEELDRAQGAEGSTPRRQQINQITSFIDGSNFYRS